MKTAQIVCMRAVDTAQNSPGEFVVAYIDENGALQQRAGTDLFMTTDLAGDVRDYDARKGVKP